MDLLTAIIVGMVIVSVLSFGFGVNFLLMSQREAAEDRLRDRLGMSSEDDEVLASLIRDEAEDSVRDALGRAGEVIRTTLQQAGSDESVGAFVTRSAIIGLVAAVLVASFFGWQTLIFGLLFGYLPWWRVSRQATKRAKNLLDQMPDALDLMGRAMQTGTGLSETFGLVQREMPDPVASEFGKVYEGVRFGKDWRDTLDALIARNPGIFELRLFVSSMLLQRETGGNMVESVTRISRMIRQRSVFDAKVKALSAEARASGAILAAMPILVIFGLVAFNASYLSPLIDTGVGQVLLVLCLAAYVGGIVIMNVVSKVEA